VQEPVAELLRFGGGQVTLQQESAHPGEQVGGGQGQLQPGGVDGEVAGGEVAEAGDLAAADGVLNSGVDASAFRSARLSPACGCTR
jgi:hypothetical protein